MTEDRREVASRIRERGVFECADLAYALGNGCSVGARCEDCREWMAERLARLVEPQCDREALSSLADRIALIEHDDSRSGCEACEYFGRPDRDCERCAAYSSEERCLELAVKDAARRIREALCPGAFERVKRPKVLAADGEPLEPGQTVWHVDTGHEYVVVEPSYGDTVVVRLAKYDDAEGEQYTPDQLTHQRPVLDADGVPIKEGDIVYFAGWGTKPFVVKELHDTDDADLLMAERIDGSRTCLKPWKLTHAKPEADSWERIEADADALAEAEVNGRGSYNAANDYCNAHGLEDGTVWVLMARDLVRRAKALAKSDAS